MVFRAVLYLSNYSNKVIIVIMHANISKILFDFNKLNGIEYILAKIHRVKYFCSFELNTEIEMAQNLAVFILFGKIF